MQIEDFKTWHWVLIGLLVGVLFGGVRLAQGPWYDMEGLETADQGQFEREAAGDGSAKRRDARLIETYHAGLPLLKNVVVHPPTPRASKVVTVATTMGSLNLNPLNAC